MRLTRIKGDCDWFKEIPLVTKLTKPVRLGLTDLTFAAGCAHPKKNEGECG